MLRFATGRVRCCGWPTGTFQDAKATNLFAAQGVALREATAAW